MQTRIQLNRTGVRADLILEGPEGKPPTLDGEVLRELAGHIESLHAEPPRALVVGSASPKYFCVGANLNVLKTTNEETIVPWVEQGHDVLNRLEDLPCPVIARVTGYAMGGGLELAMACDLILAHDNARFAQSEDGLGFIPGWGGTRRLPERIGAARAKRMFFTGEMIDAATAADWGLVDAVGSPKDIDALLADWTGSIQKQSAYALGTFKRILTDEARAARDRNRGAEAEHSRGCLRDPETLSRLNDFLEKKNR